MLLPVLHPKTLSKGFLILNLPPCSHISIPCIIGFDMNIIHQRIQTTRLHASCCHNCHYCNVDFVLFHNVTCYTNSLLSRTGAIIDKWVTPIPYIGLGGSDLILYINLECCPWKKLINIPKKTTKPSKLCW